MLVYKWQCGIDGDGDGYYLRKQWSVKLKVRGFQVMDTEHLGRLTWVQVKLILFSRKYKYVSLEGASIWRDGWGTPRRATQPADDSFFGGILMAELSIEYMWSLYHFHENTIGASIWIDV